MPPIRPPADASALRGSIEDRVRRTLDLAGGVLARHTAGVTTLGDRTPELQAAFGRARAIVDSQNLAFEQAKTLPMPHLRQQRLFSIPMAMTQAAVADLLAVLEGVKADPELAAAFSTGSKGPALSSPVVSQPAPAYNRLLALFSKKPEPLPDPAEAEQAAAHARLAQEVHQTRLVYKYASGRVAIVEKGVILRQKPHEDADAILAAESSKVREIAKQLAKLFALQPGPLQRSQVAIQQAIDLRRELYLADQAISQDDVRPAIMADLRGKAIPVRNFPRTFCRDPILQKLFPVEATSGAGGLGARRLGAPGAGQELPPGTNQEPPPGREGFEANA